MPLFENLGSGNAGPLTTSTLFAGNLALFTLIVLSLKLMATSITVGSGLSGGLTGPLLILGAASGAMLSSLLGVEWGTPEYFSILCCSTAGILSTALNVPLAAILIAVAVFDSSYVLPAAIGSFLSFMLFRSRTIFDYPEDAAAGGVTTEEIAAGTFGNSKKLRDTERSYLKQAETDRAKSDDNPPEGLNRR
jgi:H+/Cl- antiporter ClcA